MAVNILKGEMSRQRPPTSGTAKGSTSIQGLQLRWQVCHPRVHGKEDLLAAGQKPPPAGVPSRIAVWNQHPAHQRAGGSRALLGHRMTTLANAMERSAHPHPEDNLFGQLKMGSSRQLE
uniref:Uncharacterized protein n=1 Tax=Macrostomum lignano TaxID=282301 RepID=A0A1I8FIM5_9PLAT